MMMMMLVVQDEHEFIGVAKYLPMHGNDLMNQKKKKEFILTFFT